MRRLIPLSIFMMLVSILPARAEITPHKAIYDITMQKRHQDVDIQNIEGHLNYSLRQTCEGWMSDYQSDTVFSTRQGQKNIVNALSFVEALDGSSFHYALYQKEDGRLVDDTRGNVINSDDAATIRYRHGMQYEEADFDQKLYFPINHIETLLERAHAGEKMVSVPLFDGTADHDYQYVTAFLTPIHGQNAWHVDMAFYDRQNELPEPLYEMQFDLNDSGILEMMQVSYPDFTLIQKIRDVKLLEKPHCD